MQLDETTEWEVRFRRYPTSAATSRLAAFPHPEQATVAAKAAFDVQRYHEVFVERVTRTGPYFGLSRDPMGRPGRTRS